MAGKRKTKQLRLLPDTYRDARLVENLLIGAKTSVEIRAQLELALLESAAEQGVSIISPALARASFLEISRSTAEQGVPETTFHHYAKPTLRLLALLHSVEYNGSALRYGKLRDGECSTCHDHLARFITQAAERINLR